MYSRRISVLSMFVRLCARTLVIDVSVKVQQHFWRKYSSQGVPGRWGSRAKMTLGGEEGGGGRFGYFLELHNEVLNTTLAGSTTPSLSSPHAIFAQLFSIRFPRYLEAWNRLQVEQNIHLHMIVQISNWVKTFQRKEEPSLTCH